MSKQDSTKRCELHCEQCDCPICALCVSSVDHEQHFKVDIFKKFEEKKVALQNDIQELENHVHPKYRDIVSEIPIQRKDFNKILKIGKPLSTNRVATYTEI